MDTSRWVWSVSVEGMARSLAVRAVVREMEQVLPVSEEASGTSIHAESDGGITKCLTACMRRSCMDRPGSPSLPPWYAHAT